jgi:REP element-mobilizing transposase RayT
MPRHVRIEFAGAMYHVMARGDHREAIVNDDEDRGTFLRTLGEACKRSGFRIHAHVLMTNHYHLLLETPGKRGQPFNIDIFSESLRKRKR